jgi:phosphatidylglycerophosphatase A
MESEARVMGNNGKPEWRRIGKRANHLWDCEVMQLVASAAFGFLGAPRIVEQIKEDEVESDNKEVAKDEI